MASMFVHTLILVASLAVAVLVGKRGHTALPAGFLYLALSATAFLWFGEIWGRHRILGLDIAVDEWTLWRFIVLWAVLGLILLGLGVWSRMAKR